MLSTALPERCPSRRHHPTKKSRTLSCCGTSSDRERSEEHTSELQSRLHLVCRLLLEKKKSNRLPFEYSAVRRPPLFSRLERQRRRAHTLLPGQPKSAASVCCRDSTQCPAGRGPAPHG